MLCSTYTLSSQNPSGRYVVCLLTNLVPEIHNMILSFTILGWISEVKELLYAKIMFSIILSRVPYQYITKKNSSIITFSRPRDQLAKIQQYSLLNIVPTTSKITGNFYSLCFYQDGFIETVPLWLLYCCSNGLLRKYCQINWNGGISHFLQTKLSICHSSM